MDQIAIGAFIRELRREKGQTQEELAERLGVSQRSVSRWETGKTLPDYALLPGLCEALDVNAAELLNGKRIEGDHIPKPDVTEAVRAMIALIVRKKGVRRLVGALLSALIALGCMLGLYENEFSVSVDSTVSLEQAVDAYQLREAVSADVLERVAVGKQLFVLYGDRNCPGACGLACLERGIFGRYRFLFCDESPQRWISARVVTIGRRQYCVSYAVNELPGVDRYGICGMIYKDGESMATDPPGPAVLEEYHGSPFLQVTEVDRNLVLGTQRIKYYAQGEEIPFGEMEARFGPYQLEEAPNTSTATAERWLIYALEGIVLALGIIFVRYFLTEDKR